MREIRRVALALCAAGVLSLGPSAVASADLTFGTSGSAAGQTESPRGVASDWEAGLLFVADRVNQRVDVFDSSGNFVRAFGWGVLDGSPELQVCIATCQAGIAGSGAGQFSNPAGIAVDNDPASPAFHDVYVYDSTNKRIQRFHPNGEFVRAFGWGVLNGNPEAQVCTTTCLGGISGPGEGQFESMRGIGVGPGGTVYEVDQKVISASEVRERLQKFNPDGTLIEVIPELTKSLKGDVVGFAVDQSTGDFYVATNASTGAVRKYDPTGAELTSFNPSFNINALATDPAGNVYVADGTGIDSIRQYDPSGSQLRAFGYGSLGLAVSGFAFFEEGPQGTVCTSQGSGATSKLVCFEVPPPGPIVLPEPGRTFAEPIGNVKATLNATIDPEGKETTFHFEYVEEATFLETGFAEAKRAPPSPAEDQTVEGSDFRLYKESQLAGCKDPQDEAEVPLCLQPEAKYHFRAVAENEDGEDTGPEATFETKSAPEFKALWSTQVGQKDAVVHARIDPLGIPTTGHFQYVDEETFEESGFDEAEETFELDFGASEGEPAPSRSAQLSGLTEATTYHYRLLATNFAGQAEGPAGTFTTFPAAPAFSCPNDALRSGPAAKLPDCRAYELVSPPDKEGGDIVVLRSTSDTGLPAEVPQGAASGQALAYASYRSFGDAESAPFTSQYLARRDAAKEEWANQGISPPREGASFYSVASQDTQYRLFSEDLCAGWLLTDTEPVLGPGGVAGFGNLYRRGLCGEAAYGTLTTVEPPVQKTGDYIPEVQGTSADGARAVYRANDKLTPDASAAVEPSGSLAGQPIFQLYGSAEGQQALISVLPGGAGEASDASSSLGTGRAGDVLGSGFRHDSLTHALSADGSRAYWTVGGGVAGSGPGTLYLRQNPFAEGATECLPEDPESPCTVAVSEAVEEAGSEAPAQFWLASSDGSRALFSFTSGALANRLYEYDASAEEATPVAGQLGGVLGASADAASVYLTSSEALAPGAVAGKANLYLYRPGGAPEFTLIKADVGSAGAGDCALAAADAFSRCSRITADGDRLAFMSTASLTGYDNADASSGEADAEVYLYDASEDELRCVSCNPANSRPEGKGGIAAALPTQKTAFHTPRALSADGTRLFFESFDPLLPRDANGHSDLYEWEQAAGTEECEEKKAELYVPEAGGCISLISSGESPEEIEFVDASDSGDDVFFKTEQSLVGRDPGLFDVYDARVGGGFKEPAPPQPPCEGEACAPAPPAPPVQTPSSATYAGDGQAHEAKPHRKRCPKGKHKVKRKGKVRCVKKKGHHPHKKNRRHRRAGR